MTSRRTWARDAGFWVACGLVLGLFAVMARSGFLESLCPTPQETYYNLLARAFRAGQLNLPKEVPEGLARLADPFDPVANDAYRTGPAALTHDLSYFRGKFYLYFGPAPALVLFWPYAAITGRYLWHRDAVLIFCAAGFLTQAALLRALKRRYFPNIGEWTSVAGALICGLAAGLPVMLVRSEVYETAIACGYLFTMLALAAIWRALHEPDRCGRWIAAASAAYGFAVASRPSLLIGAACLLIPVLEAARERRAPLRRLGCAAGPLAALGLGLILYNLARFGRVFEFGQHYQLAADRQDAIGHFSPRFLGFNLRTYLLEPARWIGHFPFVQRPDAQPLPIGHAKIEDPFGALPNIPILWLALAAPLALRNGGGGALRPFLAAVATLFTASLLTLACFYGCCSRYEVEFLPELAILAVTGLFALERSLAGRPVLRRTARCVWILLLAASVTFNLLESALHDAEARNFYGVMLVKAGKRTEAGGQFTEALRLDPELGGAHINLGIVLAGQHRLDEAIAQYKEGVRLIPDMFGAWSRLADLLVQDGRFAEAIGTYNEALRIEPNSPDAHAHLGVALARLQRWPEAIFQFEAALRLAPGDADIHEAFARVLDAAGRPGEARLHDVRASQLRDPR